jgi:NADH-quinone oxidoreductase subunit N
MWAADVYQGAPIPVTAYLSVASKGAGLAFLFQVFYRLFGSHLAEWGLLVAIFAAVTMTVGNVVAIVQPNIKRFMAFSAISQAGYLIMGFLGRSAEGVPAMLFYMLVYILTNLAVFAGIVWYSNETGREEIKDYRGLSRTNPLMALAIMLGLFSLAGIPPLAGFVGKFYLFAAVVQQKLYLLALVGFANSLVALYYYVRVIRTMFLDMPRGDEGVVVLDAHNAFLLYVLAIPTIVLGIYWAPVIALADRSVRFFLG